MVDIFLRPVTGQDIYLYDPTVPDAADVDGTVESSTEASSSSSLTVGAAPVQTPPAFGPGSFTWAGREQPQFVSFAIASGTETATKAKAAARTSLGVASVSATESAVGLTSSVLLPVVTFAAKSASESESQGAFAHVPAPNFDLVVAVGCGSGTSARLTFTPAVEWSIEDEESDLEDILMLLATV